MLDKAENEGPQFVRRRKREFVLMTREQHDAITTQTTVGDKLFVSAWEALQPSSGAKFDLEFPKRNGKLRAVKL